MRIFKFVALTSIIALSLNKVHAQMDAQFTQYMFTKLYHNPAFAGIEGAADFSLIHRSQWFGYEASFDDGGAPNSNVFMFSAPLLKINSGIGFHVVNDRLANQSQTEIQLAYSYHLPLGKGKLGIGIEGGMFLSSIDFSQYRAVDQNDPYLQQGQENQGKPDMGIGVWYKSKEYWGGLALNHLLTPDFDYGTSSTDTSEAVRNSLTNHFNIMGGYNFEVTTSLIVTPSFIYKYNIQSVFESSSYELSTLATYNDKYWGGLNYRQAESIGVILGLATLENNKLRMGAAFDYVAFNQDAFSPFSFELLASYTLPVSAPGTKPIIRTPRFRH